MKQDFRGLVLQAQGLQNLGERTITTAAEAVIQTNDFTLAVKLDTPAPLTIPLPPPADLPEGPGSVRLRIRDAAGNAATYPITISGNGALIAGSATVLINSNWGSVDLEWTGAEWVPWAGSGNGGSVVTGSGDWTGQSNNNTVVKIQRNPILATILGMLDAGKSLVWDGAQWLAGALSAILYAPAVPGNWSGPPTNPQDAFDQLAARVKALETASAGSLETAGAPLAVGISVYRASTGKMISEDATYAALRDAFAGFTTTAAAADGDPVTVAGNGQRATGLTSIVVGTGYYVSDGVLIPESGIAAFVAGSSSGVWYRFVGTGDTTTSIKQTWGEPQQVP